MTDKQLPPLPTLLHTRVVDGIPCISVSEHEHLMRAYALQALALRPAAVPMTRMKDGEIAAMVNSLRDIARQFHGHDSLRERIANVLVPALKAEAKTDEPVAWRYQPDDGLKFPGFTQYEAVAVSRGKPGTVIPLYTHPTPGVPDGWRIEEKGGDIIVRKDGFGGYSARKNTESIAEAVLHELALDLLAASHAQKGD